MTLKKILNCSRALVVLLAVTTGFSIAVYKKTTTAPERAAQPKVNLEAVNTKLDRILEEGRARDTILLQQILKLQQQGNRVPNGLITEISKN